MLDLRKIDELVAKHVMGLNAFWFGPELVYTKGEYVSEEQPKYIVDFYSSDISAAWEVVEKLELVVVSNFEGGWYAGQPAWLSPATLEVGNEVEAGTAPLAICLAALKVKGIGYE